MTTDLKTPVKKLGNKDFILTAIGVAVVGLLMVGVAVYLRMTAPPDDGSYIPGQTELTPSIELLRDYVMIDTTAGKEIEGAQFLLDYLERNGVEAELIESAAGRANVYARIHGASDEDALLLLNHIDVYSVNPDEWSHDPFGGEIALDRLWGRGTLDMKGTAITQLLAFIDVAKSAGTPEHDLIFLATADEEKGSNLGMRWLRDNRPEIFEGVRYVINEGGLTETVRDKLVYFAVETGSKNIVRFRVRGPERQPLEKFHRRLKDWYIEPKIERLLPGVDEYFKAIATRRRRAPDILADVRKAEAEGRLEELGSNYLELLQNFAIVREDVHEDGDGGFTFVAFLSLLPDEDPEVWIDRTRKMLPPGTTLTAEAMVFEQSSMLSSTDTALFRILENEVRNMWGDQSSVGPHIMLSQMTDCRFLRSESVDCYGLWPFQVTFFESQGIHLPDERLKLSWFLEGEQLMKRIVFSYLGLDASAS